MPILMSRRTLGLFAVAVLVGGAAADTADAQIGGLGRALGRAAGRLNLDSVLRGDPPITTSLPDARWAVDSLDSFTPREAKRSMLQLQRTPNGGFVLQPGYYEMHTQSYCLKAGTHGPGGGDGYIFAPTKGPAEDAVTTILRNSVNHPEIHQHQVQTLLWAIIARAKFEDLSAEHKATADQAGDPGRGAASPDADHPGHQLRADGARGGAGGDGAAGRGKPRGAQRPLEPAPGRLLRPLHPAGLQPHRHPGLGAAGEPVGGQGVRSGHAHRRPGQHRPPAPGAVRPRPPAELIPGCAAHG
jgi:hypothetical protein